MIKPTSSGIWVGGMALWMVGGGIKPLEYYIEKGGWRNKFWGSIEGLRGQKKRKKTRKRNHKRGY